MRSGKLVDKFILMSHKGRVVLGVIFDRNEHRSRLISG